MDGASYCSPASSVGRDPVFVVRKIAVLMEGFFVDDESGVVQQNMVTDISDKYTILVCIHSVMITVQDVVPYLTVRQKQGPVNSLSVVLIYVCAWVVNNTIPNSDLTVISFFIHKDVVAAKIVVVDICSVSSVASSVDSFLLILARHDRNELEVRRHALICFGPGNTFCVDHSLYYTVHDRSQQLVVPWPPPHASCLTKA